MDNTSAAVELYIRRNGRVLGPFQLTRLHEMAVEGRVDKNTEVSFDKSSWQQAGGVPGIFAPPAESSDAPRTIRSTPSIKQKRPAAAPPALETEEYGDDNSVPPPPLRLRRPAEQSGHEGNGSPATEPPALPSHLPPLAHVAMADGEPPSVFELIWNPTGALPALYAHHGDRKALYAGLFLALLCLLCLFIVLHDVVSMEGGELFRDIEEILRVLVVISVPFLTLVGACMIVRVLFGNREHGGVGGDMLIAGAAYLPISLSGMLIYFVAKNVLPGSEPVFSVTLMAGMAVYGYSTTILTLFAGMMRIDRIRESAVAFLIPFALVLNTIFCILIYRYMLEQQWL